MKYFKNTELAKLNQISEKSVRNWVEAAQQGKLNLELYTHGEHTYIADTLHNNVLIAQLVARGKKYRNRLSFKVLQPSTEFYNLYTPAQVIDIVANLDLYREIPLGYTYFGKGATYWNEYCARALLTPGSSTLKSDLELIRRNFSNFDSLLEDYSHLNIVDLGTGNGMATRELLAHMASSGKLRRYIGIDISQDMLDIAKNNLQTWLGHEIRLETHQRDFSHQRFSELLLADSYGKDATQTANLMLFAGTTITNFREPDQPLHTIRGSMGRNDLLVTCLRLDGEKARHFFDFGAEKGASLLGPRHKYLPDLLNIDPSFYEVEQFFDERARARIIQIRLKIALSLDFEVGAFRKTLDLAKGERIILWRCWHYTDYEIIDKFDQNGFSLLQATKSKDQEYMLLVSRVKTRSQLDVDT